ncbi:MAG: HEAT repeat domain-containing protein [Myxococcota bacterium]
MDLDAEVRLATEQLLSCRDDASCEAAYARLRRSYLDCSRGRCEPLAEVAALALPQLVAALADPDPAVRGMACRGFGFFAPDADDHVDRLEAMAADPVCQVRLEALDALAELGPHADAWLLRTLLSEAATPEERERAAELCRAPSLPAFTVSALVDALTRRAPAEQAAAARILSALLEDVDEVREEVSAALAALARHSAP